MRAVVAERPGPPHVLRMAERPGPTAGPGEVVIDVTVAATTFIDMQLRAGRGPRPLPPDEFPVVLGNGVAGVVAAVGEGVEAGWLGRRVVSTTGGRGGYAEQVAARAADLHPIPAGLDDHTAVALLADGRTALALAGAAQLHRGDTVAVTAAAGGVGSLLVQLAVEAGATVIGLAGSPSKLAHATALGAARTIDYERPGWPSELDAAGPFDVVFDGVGGAVSAALASRMAEGGRFVQHGAASGAWGDVAEMLVARGATLIPLDAIATDPAVLHALVDTALGRAAAGTLRPTIGQTFPLEEAAEAHALMEARQAIGKTLLIVDRS